MEDNNPPKPIIPQNISDRNFKRFLLFSLVERSGNNVSRDVNVPKVFKTTAIGKAITSLLHMDTLLRGLCLFELYFPRRRGIFK